MAIEYYVFDIESSGLISKNYYHEINEISAIRVSNRMQILRYIKAEYPERANADALRITNKTLADLNKGISRQEAIQQINEFLALDGLTKNHRCIIAHNAVFDRNFCHALWETCGQEFPATLWLDTIQLMRKHIKDSGIEANLKKQGLPKAKVNLTASCDLLGIKKFSGAHQSSSDTRNTYLLHKKLTEDLGIDYLPLIKTVPHILKSSNTEEKEDLIDFSQDDME